MWFVALCQSICATLQHPAVSAGCRFVLVDVQHKPSISSNEMTFPIRPLLRSFGDCEGSSSQYFLTREDEEIRGQDVKSIPRSSRWLQLRQGSPLVGNSKDHECKLATLQRCTVGVLDFEHVDQTSACFRCSNAPLKPA